MVVLPKQLRHLFIPSVFLNSKPLKYVAEHKFLGVFISNDLSDNCDIKRHVRALYGRGNMLVSKFKFCSPEVKNCLFQSYCTNIYGGPLWCKYTTSDYKKAVVAFNDVYRTLFSIKRGESMSAIYVRNNVQSLNTTIRRLSYGLKCRLACSENIYVRCIVNSLFHMSHSSLTKLWNRNLYVSGLYGANKAMTSAKF